MPWRRSAATASVSPSWALPLSRVKIAVTSETVMIECGSMKMRKAKPYEVSPAAGAPARSASKAAPVRTGVVTRRKAT